MVKPTMNGSNKTATRPTKPAGTCKSVITLLASLDPSCHVATFSATPLSAATAAKAPAALVAGLQPPMQSEIATATLPGQPQLSHPAHTAAHSSRYNSPRLHACKQSDSLHIHVISSAIPPKVSGEAVRRHMPDTMRTALLHFMRAISHLL